MLLPYIWTAFSSIVLPHALVHLYNSLICEENVSESSGESEHLINFTSEFNLIVFLFKMLDPFQQSSHLTQLNFRLNLM